MRAGCALSGFLRRFYRCNGVAAAGQFFQLTLDPRLIFFKPRQARLGLRNFRFGNAPFGFDPGMVCGCLCQGEFSRPRGTFGIFGLAREFGPTCFVFLKRGLARGDFAFKAGKCFGRIAGDAAGIAAILFKPSLLAIKIGQPLLSRFELAGERCHPVAMRAGIVAPVSQLVAGLRNGLGCDGLRLLRFAGCLFGVLNALVGFLRCFAGFLCHPRGIAPAGVKQPRFSHFDLG